MRVATGSYLADGNSRDIVLTFDPVFVLFQEGGSGTTRKAALKLSPMSGSNGLELTAQNPNLASNVCTLATGGFTVGTSALVNTSGQTYYWMALGADAAHLEIGSYVTNNTDDRNIATAFVPDMVYSCTASGGSLGDSQPCWHQSRGGDSSIILNTSEGAPAANYIQGTGSIYFQVGSSWNPGGSLTIYYVCFKKKTGFIAQESYAGNGGNDHDVVMADAFQPTVVLAVRRQNATMNVLSDAMSATTRYWAANATGGEGTDRIKALNANGFRLGTSTSVNASAETYDFLALADDQTQPVSRIFHLALDSSQRQQHRFRFPVEVHATHSRPFRLPLESFIAHPVSRLFFVPFLSDYAVQRPFRVPAEWAGTILVQRDFWIPIEHVASQARAFLVPAEWETGRFTRYFFLPVEAGGGVGRPFPIRVEAAGTIKPGHSLRIPVEALRPVARAFRLPMEADGQEMSFLDVFNVLTRLDDIFLDTWTVIPVRLQEDFLDTWDVRSILGGDLVDIWRVLPQQIVQLFSNDIQLPSGRMGKD